MRYSPLPVLRAYADDAPALLERVGGYLEELQVCVMNLKGLDPYGVCRLAAGALPALRLWQDGGDVAQVHAKHVIARLDLLLAQHARGVATYALGYAGNGRDAQAAVGPDRRRLHSAARSSCRAVRPGQCNRRQPARGRAIVESAKCHRRSR